MVRIRKKTSNRMTTAHRAKIKKKARETKKKRRKEAKKNPQQHKKKKKDPGIPNSFPFKEQILAEVAETRRLAAEEKQRKQEMGRSKDQDAANKSSTSTSGTIQVPTAITVDAIGEELIDNEAPPLIDTTVPHTAAALEAADLVLYLLDSRDPLSYRNSFVEQAIGDKPLAYVLNKIDLAPREGISAWAKHLRKGHPTFLFRSASSHLPPDQAQSLLNLTSGSSKAKVSDEDALGRDAVLEGLHATARTLGKSTLSIAVVGMTNVGKSAFINSMLKASTLAVYSPVLHKLNESGPSTTPYPQSVTLIHKKTTYHLIDTPGFSYIPQPLQTEEEIATRIARDVLLRNRGNISKINDPLPAGLYILSRAVMEDLLILYNLPAIPAGDYDAFLASLARKEGALQKRGAVVDFQGAARALVRDWKTGRLAHYALPSSNNHTAIDDSTTTHPDLSSIYKKSDEKILSNVRSRKELRKLKGALVQLKDAVLDDRRVDLEATHISDGYIDMEDDELEELEEMTGNGSNDTEDEMEEDESSDKEDILSGDGIEGDTGEDESEEESIEELPVVPLRLSGKQKRESARTAQVGKEKGKLWDGKKVSFSPYTKGIAKAKNTKLGKAPKR